jgi:hypothetical protein
MYEYVTIQAHALHSRYRTPHTALLIVLF